MSRPSIFLFLVAFFIGGCEILGSNGFGQVVFTTDKNQYETGETIRAKLVNNTRSELRMGACVTTEGFVSGTWSTLFQPGFCEAVEIGLGPGESHTFSVGTKHLLPAEKYRVTKRVETDDKDHIIKSNSFTFTE